MSDATNVWEDVPGLGRSRRETADAGSGRVLGVLIVSTNADPDVAEYPDTGKLAAIVGGQHRYHRTDDAVEHAGPD